MLFQSVNGKCQKRQKRQKSPVSGVSKPAGPNARNARNTFRFLAFGHGRFADGFCGVSK